MPPGGWGRDGKDSAQGTMGMGERKRHSRICAFPTVPRARSSEIIQYTNKAKSTF